MDDEAARLTEEHRIGQARIAAEAARAALDGWRQVSPTNLEETAARWLAATVRAQRGFRGRSRRLSAAYNRLLRALRIGRTLPPLPDEPPIDPALGYSLGQMRDTFSTASGQPQASAADDAQTVPVDEDFAWPEEDEEAADRRATVALVVTGPVHAGRAMADLQFAPSGGRLDDPEFLTELSGLMQTAGALTAGAADRDSLMGGRDLLEGVARADRAVIGWARVTADNPCDFCAMLASRGAVYRSEWSASYSGQLGRTGAVDRPDDWQLWTPEQLLTWEVGRGVQRFHDNCHCTILPIYSREDWLPEESMAFRELWEEATRGLSGADARRAFRLAIEARRRRAQARGVSVR
ncbi:VG15 protein [Streptomyces fructofermentans]|uniref:Capsid maturation protease n=1 Tax=Streptomyces fructofermentans TaxID=152141 RepID=A0A918NV38_9ACTN|nr:hypothetical protein [Streptomyces fructofermentans]GGX98519.1 hypothetical protein GCM10010515_75900 [Streptomyces fructofermentans]